MKTESGTDFLRQKHPILWAVLEMVLKRLETVLIAGTLALTVHHIDAAKEAKDVQSAQAQVNDLQIATFGDVVTNEPTKN